MVAALHATEFPSSALQLFYTHTASRGALSVVVLQPLQRLLAYVFKHVGSCFGRFPVMSWYHCDRCGTRARCARRTRLKPHLVLTHCYKRHRASAVGTVATLAANLDRRCIFVKLNASFYAHRLTDNPVHLPLSSV